jgi:hypothetical protein
MNPDEKPLRIDGQPFLKSVLIDDWERYGAGFQDYLVSSGQSSNMCVVARKPSAVV